MTDDYLSRGSGRPPLIGRRRTAYRLGTTRAYLGNGQPILPPLADGIRASSDPEMTAIFQIMTRRRLRVIRDYRWLCSLNIWTGQQLTLGGEYNRRYYREVRKPKRVA
jgi:hypothetical protein